MLTFVAYFVFSFAFVGVLGMTVAWGMSARAELKAWKTKHQRWMDAQNHAAWRANREMIMY
jgi:hypothetical protein